MNRCDCGACLDFYGIALDPWRAWRVCPRCGTYYAADEAGGVRLITTAQPSRRDFKVARAEEEQAA